MYNVYSIFYKRSEFFYLSTPGGKRELPCILKCHMLELMQFIYLFNIAVGLLGSMCKGLEGIFWLHIQIQVEGIPKL